MNDTTTDSVANPVAFGDDVRVDGRLWRGATAGPSDSLPFIVNDNMEIAGDLVVVGSIEYDNSRSGLAAITVTGAIDEIGRTFGDLILKTGELSAGVYETTTWTGYHYAHGSASDPAVQSDEGTLTFTPTSASTGTFTSEPFYAFDYVGSSLDGCTGRDGVFSGNYEIVAGMLFTYVTSSTATGCTASSIVATSAFSTDGETVTFVTNRTTPHYVSVFDLQD
ncbi:MAG: hypothetical protein V1853_03715 [bacterium]